MQLLDAKHAQDAALQAEALCRSNMEEAGFGFRARLANGRLEEATLSARREAEERDAILRQDLNEEQERQQQEISLLQASLHESNESLHKAEEKRQMLEKIKEEAETHTKEAQDVSLMPVAAAAPAFTPAAAPPPNTPAATAAAAPAAAAVAAAAAAAAAAVAAEQLHQLHQLQSQCSSLSAKVKALEAELGSSRLRQEREAQEAWGIEYGLRLQLKALQAGAAETEERLSETRRLLSSAKEQELLLAQSVSELKASLAEETAKSQEAAANHQAEVEQQRQRLEAEKDEALAAAAAAAAAAAKADLLSLKQQHEDALKAAEAQAEKQRKALRTQLLAEHTAQLQAILCSHRSQQEEKEKEHQQEKDALAKSLKDAAAASAAAAAAAAAARLNAAAEQVRDLQQQLEGTKEELRLREAESSERLEALESLRLAHQQAVAAHQEAAERQKAELCKQQEEARQREQALELLNKLKEQGLQRNHEAALAELYAEQKAEIALYQMRINALESRLEAQIRQFEKRPSREEDLDTIDKLTKTLEESKAALLQREEVIRRLKVDFLSQ
ncbi:hypothetical protein Emag_004949 [Eimeria magna]